ncbi:uncharacterized protein [Palaemon carinicauda]|uniref:uncharacterized protein n=1 Tax=Palaemon carinicauda TaxID=392227 RepID=UPI0035B6769D
MWICKVLKEEQMSTVNVLFDNYDHSSPATCLRAMRLSLLKFSKVHNSNVLGHQIPNAHETYLPISLSWDSQNEVNVNDLFVTDFSSAHGTLDLSDGIHKPKVFVVYGGRGLGKTALVNNLMYQWLIDEACDVKRIKDFDMAVVIEVARIKHSEAMEIKGTKILWLFDGFEKVTDGTKEAIKGAIEDFPSSQVVLTSLGKQEINTRNLMELTQAKYVALNLMPLTNATWRLRVPKMIATKTNNAYIIEGLSSRFIYERRRMFDDVARIRPKTLGYKVYEWLCLSYPWAAVGKMDPKGRGKSNR